MTEEYSRAQVLAYRVAAHGLGDGGAGDGAGALLELGVQDTPHGSARLALAARGVEPEDGGPDVALAWTVRGAPHLHPARLLPHLAAALWPLNDADARARLLWTESRHEVVAVDAMSAFRLTAEAFADVVTGPAPKGEVSAAVTERLPEELTEWCPRCKARHVLDTLFRQAALLAGVVLRREGSETMLLPLPGWSRPAPAPDPRALAGVATRYLRVLGPAGPTEVAAFLGTAANPLAAAWPDGLDEVRVQGRRAFIPPECAHALRAAPPPRGLRLLPPSDPWLQARDRALLLPGRRRRAAVWRPAARDGAILLDGEIVGTWRARSTRAEGLEIVLDPFDPLPDGTAAELDAAARRVARVRGEAAVRVRGECGT